MHARLSVIGSLALTVAGLLLASTAFSAKGPAARMTQEAIESGDVRLSELHEAGLKMFAGRFTKAVGYGDGPMDVGDTVSPGGRPTLQGNGLLLRVNGLDARGFPQSEVITIAASGGGSSTNTGTVPFATVTGIDVFIVAGVTAFVDQIVIGLGNKFGLTGRVNAGGDVLYVNEGGTVMTAGYAVDATAAGQGITFAAAPDGARNYVVVFRAR